MHGLLIVAGLLLVGASVVTAAVATSDSLRPRRKLLLLSTILFALGAAAILFSNLGSDNRPIPRVRPFL